MIITHFSADPPEAPKQSPVPTFGLPPKPDKSRHIAHREKSRVLSGSRGSSRESSPHPSSSRSSPRPASPLVAAAVAVGDGMGVPPRPPERKESLSKEFSKDLANISSDIPPELQGVSVKDLIKALGKAQICITTGNFYPPKPPPPPPMYCGYMR